MARPQCDTPLVIDYFLVNIVLTLYTDQYVHQCVLEMLNTYSLK